MKFLIMILALVGCADVRLDAPMVLIKDPGGDPSLHVEYLEMGQHTQGGIMGGADDRMWNVDRELACTTIHDCI